MYLGTSERRLFGIYEAATRRGPPRAAVLCYPLGEEYVYAHRSMRHLALKLAASGCHTIRFDYYGTGDSGGEMIKPDRAGWEADTETAIESLQEMLGVSQVTLVGLRLGANIALRVAARRATEVRSLVLWEPIIDTENHLEELRVFPNRSLVVMSETGGGAVAAHRHLENTAAGDRVTFECLSGPCPWVESVTTTGAIPVRIIQRIEQWLN